MRFDNLLSDDAVLMEFGRRLAALRVEAGLTQADLATAAGVAKRTVERLEAGGGAQLANLVRCLRALGRLSDLEALLPAVQANPLDLLERHGARRVRARRGGAAEQPAPPWRWGDEE